MPITIKDLYEKSKDRYHLNLLAGEAGMNHTVSWVQFTEDIMTVDFLKGSEFLFTTGLNSYGDKWIYDFIVELIHQKAAGLIINVGKYISEVTISPEIKELCNKHNFPLFSMPWEIHLSDIMQDYCNQLLEETKYQDKITTILKEILTHPQIAESYYNELETYGFASNETYCVMSIQLIPSKNKRENSKNDIIQITNILNDYKTKYHGFIYEKHIVFIWHNFDWQTIELAVNYLEKCNLIEAIGVSGRNDHINSISRGYSESLAALNFAKKMHINSGFFDKMGMDRLLFFIKDQSILHKIYWENLGVLIEYDQNHKSCLLETLEYYIMYDGSIQKVAEKMFTHRNTVNYRVRKIKELLNNELTTMEIKFNLQMAFYIKNFLRL